MLRRVMMADGGGGGDPEWPNVSALLHCNGDNDSTDIIDETGKAWVPAGNAKITTAHSVFGGACVVFDGVGAWLDAPPSADFSFGTGAFAWECWARFSGTGNRALFSIGSNWTLYRANDSKLYLYDGVNNILDGGVQSLDVFDFIQLVREDGVLKLARNGSVLASTPHTVNLASTNMRIGASTNGASNMQGLMDEIRVTNGSGRPILLPTAPFPNY